MHTKLTEQTKKLTELVKEKPINESSDPRVYELVSRIDEVVDRIEKKLDALIKFTGTARIGR